MLVSVLFRLSLVDCVMIDATLVNKQQSVSRANHINLIIQKKPLYRNIKTTPRAIFDAGWNVSVLKEAYRSRLLAEYIPVRLESENQNIPRKAARKPP